VPVDFEVANVDSSLSSEDDINNAIMAIRRNGVALKGVQEGGGIHKIHWIHTVF